MSYLRRLAAGSPDSQGSYLHYAPRTEEERREQRKAARLALVRRSVGTTPCLCDRQQKCSPGSRLTCPDAHAGNCWRDRRWIGLSGSSLG